jgi:hypothetical protein
MSPIAFVGEKLASQAIASATLASNATTTATSSGTATNLLALPRAAFEGGTYRVFLYAHAVTRGTTSVTVELWVDSVFWQTVVAASTATGVGNPFFWVGLVSLAPGSHLLEFRGFVDAGTGTLVAGSGATGQPANAVGFVIPA